jgi:alpha-ketoglutarate-dependent taurine dioxygenase
MIPCVTAPAGADIGGWLRGNRDRVDAALRDSGALRFGGFGLGAVPAFEQLARATCGELLRDNPEHTSVSDSGNVQTPVPYSARRKLLWHNENTFGDKWPGRILFACAVAPDSGGETPLADTRAMYRALRGPARSRFSELGITYQRTYGTGVGLSWQQVFQTADPAEAEGKCRSADVQFEWGEGNRLRTRQTRPAIVKHPVTSELVWVAQPQHWHPACLDPQTRESLVAVLGEDRLPRDCFFGDGSRIEAEIMNDLCAAYQEHETSFSWQPGSAVLIDNLILAHGRNPYAGERKILVAMGSMYDYRALARG